MDSCSGVLLSQCGLFLGVPNTGGDGVGIGEGDDSGLGTGVGVGAGAGAGTGAGVCAGVGVVIRQLVRSIPDNDTISIIMHKINSLFIFLYLVSLRRFTFVS
jgi:hypothetical protein